MVHLAREEVFSPDEIACVHVMNRAAVKNRVLAHSGVREASPGSGLVFGVQS